MLASKLNGESTNYDQYKDALSALMDSKFDLVCQCPEQTFVDITTFVLSLIRVETNILYKCIISKFFKLPPGLNVIVEDFHIALYFTMFTVLGLWEQWQKQQIVFGTIALF